MTAITVRHRSGEYFIRIGADDRLYEQLAAVADSRPTLIVTDGNVAAHWLTHLQTILPHAASLVLPAGETAKTLVTVERIWSELSALAYGRDALIVALGGGVVGDMAGFAAACWMRGIDFIQVPTTLLAQVDASIGGKTGVDLPAGKNLVGAFHQPAAVFIDLRVLETLPQREYAAGMAEIVKAALIADAGFLDWLAKNAGALIERDTGALQFAIRRSCEIKSAVVVDDERETGKRAMLNLGHTFAHAIESVTHYKQFLHGEAVAIGLVLAAELSTHECGLDASVLNRLAALLESFGLPVHLPAGIDNDALIDAMRRDKKHRHGRWRLVLLEAPGHAVIREYETADVIRGLLKRR